MSVIYDARAACDPGSIVQTAAAKTEMAEEMAMRSITLFAVLLAGIGVSRAGGLDVHVFLSGEVAPGLYGQVNIGGAPPPPVVYAQPMLIEPQAVSPPPIYLHVPPGHAKNWRMHCHEYNACNRPVYFVRSQEYDPEYQRHYAEHERDRELERQRWQERQHGHGHGHDGDEHDHGHEGHDHHDDK
jgi:hypothetical protein